MLSSLFLPTSMTHSVKPQRMQVPSLPSIPPSPPSLLPLLLLRRFPSSSSFLMILRHASMTHDVLYLVIVWWTGTRQS